MLDGTEAGPLTRIRQALAFRNASAVYVLILVIIVYAFWIPDLFLRVSNLQTVLYENSVTAMLGVGLVIPFAAGVFDASIGATLGFASVVVAYLTAHGMPWQAAALVALAIGAAVGAVNAAVVIGFRVDSIIATLAMMSVLTGLGTAVGNNLEISVPNGMLAFGSGSFIGLGYPVWVLIAVTVVIAYVLDWTAIGRRVHATGGGEEAARLAGVRTKRIQVASLVFSGVVAALAGVVATARVGAGQFDIGPPYLLPAFAAVFLGATQIRPGRYNAWGTILATYTLAIGVNGLLLGGAPDWTSDVFDGAALMLAVSLSVRRASSAGRLPWRTRRQARSESAVTLGDRPGTSTVSAK